MNSSSPKPRVLRILSRMAPGGVQRGVLATLALRDSDSFEYAVLCTKKAGDWADEVRAMGVPLVTQKTLPPWDPYQIARLAGVIRGLRPDIVHIHMAPTVLGAASAARLAGVPWRRMVIHHHNDYTRHWNEQPALLRAWEHAMTRRAGAVLAVSHAVAGTTRERVGVEPTRLRVVFNGIDIEKFRDADPRDPRAEWGLAAETPLAVYTARFLATKRIEDFIRASTRVRDRWPADRGPAPVFVVLGGGAQNYWERYRKAIADAGAGKACLLAGTREDVPGILRTAQVGALCSEMEGFAQVVHEYQAAGIPVVSSDQACVTERLTHERDALIYPTGDVEALSEAILRALTDNSLSARLIAGGRELLPRFMWETAARAYEAVYRVLSPARVR